MSATRAHAPGHPPREDRLPVRRPAGVASSGGPTASRRSGACGRVAGSATSMPPASPPTPGRSIARAVSPSRRHGRRCGSAPTRMAISRRPVATPAAASSTATTPPGRRAATRPSSCTWWSSARHSRPSASPSNATSGCPACPRSRCSRSSSTSSTVPTCAWAASDTRGRTGPSVSPPSRTATPRSRDPRSVSGSAASPGACRSSGCATGASRDSSVAAGSSRVVTCSSTSTTTARSRRCGPRTSTTTSGRRPGRTSRPRCSAPGPRRCLPAAPSGAPGRPRPRTVTCAGPCGRRPRPSRTGWATRPRSRARATSTRRSPRHTSTGDSSPWLRRAADDGQGSIATWTEADEAAALAVIRRWAGTRAGRSARRRSATPELTAG